ncbi:MAG: FIST signal transduction protein [Bacteroidota bacterium]|jgi:hypothetical protein
MIADQIIFKNNSWEGFDKLKNSPENYQLILVMGDKSLVLNDSVLDALRQKFSKAIMPVLSTAGEIYNGQSNEGTLVGIALHFEHTPLEVVENNIHNFSDSTALGEALAEALPKENLRYILAISCGSLVNGEDLIRGITKIVGEEILITGGMAGDGDRFQSTAVGCATKPQEGNVVLVGFYGDHIRVSSGVKSGWSFFGPERIITESEKNKLYTVDGENALELYKRYLGEFAKQLPSSALFFPLAILSDDTDVPLVRTILSVNEKEGSMTFAGNIPKGARVRLMRTNTEQIINNAGMAGEEAQSQIENGVFALTVNCIGRKLVLGAMSDNEINAMRKSLSPETLLAGFYSYGEFSRFFIPANACQLHNQTVVVTLFDEI